MKCFRCNQDISIERLEVVPDATLCVRCARGLEPAVQKTFSNPIDQTPYIEAKVVPVSRNASSFRVKSRHVLKKVKKAIVEAKPKYTQIGGLTPSERKNTENTSKDELVAVTFNGTTTVYQYRIKTFERRFKINRNEIRASLNIGYSFYVDGGILYLDRKGKKPNVRIGSFHKRKEV